MPTVDLTAGTIEYEDSGEGQAVVFLHGAHMNASLWRAVVDDLAGEYRCVVPTLPMGGHRLPVRADADLGLRGLARIVAELVERLDLDEVTLVGNDTGGAVAQVIVTEHPARVGRLLLASCEAFDNMPPGLPGRVSKLSGTLPAGLWMVAQSMRLPAVARAPFAFGWLAKRPVGKELLGSWFGGLRTNPEIRRDTRRFVRAIAAADLAAAGDGLGSFGRPAAVVWAREDKVMPREHAERLSRALGDSRLVWVEDSYTLIPLDQPTPLASAIRELATAAHRPGRR